MTAPRHLALITGATSGIGLALASCCARAGHPLVLVARRGDELARIAQELRIQFGVLVTCIACDLTEAGSVERLHRTCQEQGLRVGIVINNAGMGVCGDFLATPWESHEAIIRLNILAATEVVRRFLPDLVAHGGGRVLNVASTAAFLPGPLMSVYFASKAYLFSWSYALSVELRSQGVTVTALCPGPTQTGFAHVAGLANSLLFRSRSVMSAQQVAQDGYRAMMRGRAVAVSGWYNRLLVFSTRLSPRAITSRIARSVNRTPA